MMENNIHFPETVMLIDAACLSAIVTDFKRNFEKMLQRPLQPMNVAQLAVSLALDANVPAGNKETQIVFVYDESNPKLSHSMPSDLSKELNGVAFQDKLGEFIFSSLSPEGMVTRDELYFDLLHIISESPEVKRIIVVPFEQDNKEMIHAALKKFEGKEVTLFGMNKPERETSYAWQLLAYPVMQALGIRGDEIQ